MIGAAIYIMAKTVTGLGARFSRLAYLRWTVIGGVIGAVAAVALVTWLQTWAILTRAMVRWRQGRCTGLAVRAGEEGVPQEASRGGLRPI